MLVVVLCLIHERVILPSCLRLFKPSLQLLNKMNISNVLSTMRIVSQNMSFIVVHFRPDDDQNIQSWQFAETPMVVLIYSSIEEIVKLAHKVLLSKLWILVIVHSNAGCFNMTNLTTGDRRATNNTCSTTSKLTTGDFLQMEKSAEYLVLTRWLVPRNTPLSSRSILLCLMAYDDFTDVPADYRDCAQRRRVQPGEIFQPRINYFSILDFGPVSYASGIEEEIRFFLNLSRIARLRATGLVGETQNDTFRWLRTRKADMSLLYFTYTAQRLEEVAFTSVIAVESMRYFSKIRQLHRLSSLGIVFVFDKGIWICLGLLYLAFIVALRIHRQKETILLVIATQLSQPLAIARPSLIVILMFIASFLIKCMFSSGLLSSLSAPISTQIITIADLTTVMKLPNSFVCMVGDTFSVRILDEPHTSEAFQTLSHKKKTGKLIQRDSELSCQRQSEKSENVISVIMVLDAQDYDGSLVQGRDTLYVSSAGFLMSPEFPLKSKVNVLIGTFREMHIVKKMKEPSRSEQFMEIKKKRALASTRETIRVLTANDISLPLILLVLSGLLGSLVEVYLYLIARKYSRRRTWNVSNI